MRCLIRIVLGIIFVIISTAAVAAADEGEELHLIVISQTQEAEAEITVDGNRRTELMGAGMNCMSFQVDTDPEISILAYGDTYDLFPVRGKDGDWYAMTLIGAPEVEGEK